MLVNSQITRQDTENTARPEVPASGLTFQKPLGEAERLQALRATELLDSEPEEEFDELVRLASYICGTPIALMSLIDENRQWFKSKIGIDAEETAREVSFCTHAIMSDEVMVVPDATADERFAANPLVLEDPKVRFYAGAPLATDDGHMLGTLCVVDRVAHGLTDHQREALEILSKQIVRLISLRKLVKEQQANAERQRLADQELRTVHQRFEAFMANSPMAAYVKDASGKFVYTNRTLHEMFPDQPADWVGLSDADMWGPEVVQAVRRVDMGVLASGRELQVQEAVPIQGKMHHFMSYKFPIEDAQGTRFLAGMSVDITDRIVAEAEAEQARIALADQVHALEERTRQLVLLGEMGEMLQSCRNLEEAHDVIMRSLNRLFSGAGALYRLSASQTMLERVVSWGQVRSSEVFVPDECWGLRRGRPHVAGDTKLDMVCLHIKKEEHFGAMCAPLVAQREALGVLYLEGPAGYWTPDQQQLVRTVAEQVSLGLANLNLQEKLRNQSIRDAITGLFNRRYLEESLEREIHVAERNRHALSVIIFDIDHFKRFNDTFGHEAGDVLLRELGQYVSSFVRKSDIACRYGGEEFALLLPEIDYETALARADDFRRGVQELNVQYRRQPLEGVTVSMGVATYGQHGRTGAEVVHNADMALYQAKRTGRNRVVGAAEVDKSVPQRKSTDTPAA